MEDGDGDGDENEDDGGKVQSRLSFPRGGAGEAKIAEMTRCRDMKIPRCADVDCGCGRKSFHTG